MVRELAAKIFVAGSLHSRSFVFLVENAIDTLQYSESPSTREMQRYLMEV